MKGSAAITLPAPPPGRAGWPWFPRELSPTKRMLPGTAWPRISVVTPSFNQGDYVEETIRSVVLQGYPNLEFIVKDGGSRDGTVEILEKYRAWIDVVDVGPDGGQAAALADGFSKATGEIFAWLNADDLYLPGALKRVASFFVQRPHCVFAFGDVRMMTASSAPAGLLLAMETQLFLTKNTGAHGWWQPGSFWRRGAYEACGGIDSALEFCMDRDLFIRLCEVGKSARMRGGPIAVFRRHCEQKSQTMTDTFIREHEVLLCRYGDHNLNKRRRLLGRLWQMWCLCHRLRWRLQRD